MSGTSEMFINKIGKHQHNFEWSLIKYSSVNQILSVLSSHTPTDCLAKLFKCVHLTLEITVLRKEKI